MTSNTMTTAIQLAEMWQAAKADENAANARRVAIEGDIVALLGKRDDGAETHTLDNGVKITITGKQTVAADIPMLERLAATLPENLRPVKVTVAVDPAGVKFLRENHPAHYKKIAPALTIKPAKTAVTVKV
jgi:hypothetical protein